MRILLTGATGFVGSAVFAQGTQRGLAIRAAVRKRANAESVADVVQVGDLDGETDWSAALQGIDVVVHTAARTHVMRETSPDPAQAYQRVNVQGTLHLARQAAAAGARRFVFISSIKVNGESTHPGHAFTADDDPAPQDAYGRSKADAERGLQQLAAATGMELTVLRPVLVYGPQAKGNLARLTAWIQRGWPLPLGCVTTNRRSLVALDNLVDLILLCVDHPCAANQVFLVSDGEDLSTADLLQHLGRAVGRAPRLLSVPVGAMVWFAAVLGKNAFMQRLVGSLQVDTAKTSALLGWVPPLSVEDGLSKAVK